MCVCIGSNVWTGIGKENEYHVSIYWNVIVSILTFCTCMLLHSPTLKAAMIFIFHLMYIHRNNHHPIWACWIAKGRSAHQHSAYVKGTGCTYIYVCQSNKQGRTVICFHTGMLHVRRDVINPYTGMLHLVVRRSHTWMLHWDASTHYISNLPEYVYHMDLIAVVQFWGVYYSKSTTSEGIAWGGMFTKLCTISGPYTANCTTIG